MTDIQRDRHHLARSIAGLRLATRDATRALSRVEAVMTAVRLAARL